MVFFGNHKLFEKKDQARRDDRRLSDERKKSSRVAARELFFYFISYENRTYPFLYLFFSVSCVSLVSVVSSLREFPR